MNLKSIAVFFSLVGLLGSAGASDTKASWHEIAGTDSMTFYAKKGSGSLSNVDGKKQNGYSFVMQADDLKEKTSVYQQAVVLLDYCKKGFGYLILNDLKGNFLGKSAFVRFGPRAIDLIGSHACLAWDTRTGKSSGSDSPEAWQLVAESARDGAKFSMKTDTAQKTTYRGNPAVAALFRNHSESASTVEHVRYAITTSDCKKGMGTAFVLDFDGKTLSKNDFVVQGNTVLSKVAGALCGKFE